MEDDEYSLDKFSLKTYINMGVIDEHFLPNAVDLGGGCEASECGALSVVLRISQRHLCSEDHQAVLADHLL